MSRGTADVQGQGYFELDALVACAKMYALVALRLAAGISEATIREVGDVSRSGLPAS